MLKAIIRIGLAVLPAAAVLAQTGPDKLTFEVASVKPATPLTPGRMMITMHGGPGTSDPGQATFSNVTQRMLLAKAYGVQDYQISGPGWLDSERYEIAAKVPKGTTEEQFKVMLQNLLADRFKLTLHHETRDLPRYVLVVAKNGPKLKESAPPPPAPDGGAPKDGAGAGYGGPPPGAGLGPPPGPPPGEGGMPRLQMGKDGFPKLPPGAGRGGVILMMMPGRARMIGNGQPISKLADALARQLGRPVTDKTGLTGAYDFTLDFDPEGSMGGRGGMMMRMPGGPPPGGGGDGPAANPPETEAAGLFTALQEQLGLKVEQKKGPLDMLVVDHSEKVPVEN
ncbi:MAG: TIGR03435 family protein [Bryobacteraceae bacterium]